jgi:hypothetical protein
VTTVEIDFYVIILSGYLPLGRFEVAFIERRHLLLISLIIFRGHLHNVDGYENMPFELQTYILLLYLITVK